MTNAAPNSERIHHLVEAGVDLLLIETIFSSGSRHCGPIGDDHRPAHMG
jgi:hypothetical protein